MHDEHIIEQTKYQTIYRFPNHYGASVVTHTKCYGEGELAVLVFLRPHSNEWHITYTTPITSDVVGWLAHEDVDPILTEIKAL